MKRISLIIITLLILLLAISCKQQTPEDVPVDTDSDLVEEETEDTEIQSIEEIPVPEPETNSIDLGNGYSFITSVQDSQSESETTRSAYIHYNGEEVASFDMKGSALTYIGSYNEKYYFNYGGFVEAKGVYTYEPGGSSFEELCNDLNFELFDKSSAKNLWNMQHSGIMDDRYILAVPFYPTDAFNGYGEAYVYDLLTNERTSLGTARDIINTSDGIYWTDTDPYKFNDGEPFNILVKKASHSGDNVTTVKTIPINDEGISYGAGSINRRAVRWSFLNGGEDIKIEEVYREVDENYILTSDIEVMESPSDESKQLKRSALSADGQKNALPGDNAVLKKGTVVTCLEKDHEWMKIPSGWIKYMKDDKLLILEYED